MAELNPQMQQSGESNFLGYSRGQEVDQSYSGLFQDAAQGVQTGTRVVNDLIVEDIRKNVTKGVDEIRDIFIAQYRDRVDNLTQAYRSGQIRDSYYWNTLDVEARRIRNRYPGHRKEVDTIIQEVAGANPANQLMRELSQESAQTGTRNREDQRLDHWLQEGSRPEVAAPLALQYSAMAAQGRPPTWQQIQQQVAEINSRRGATSAEMQRLALRRATGENVSNEASQSFERTLNTEIGQLYSTATLPIAELDRRIETMRRSPTSGNPRAISELHQFYTGSIRGPMLARFNEVLTRQVEGQEAGTTFGTLINDPNRVKALRDQFTAQIDQLGDAINHQRWGEVARLHNSLQSYGDSAALRFLENRRHGQAYQNMLGLREVLGPQFYNNTSVLAQMNTLIPSLRELFARGAEADFRAGTPLSRRFEEYGREIPDRQQLGQITNASINALIGDLVKPDLNDEGLVNFATTLFGPANQNFLNNPNFPIQNHADVYRRIVGDVSLHQNMQRLRTIDMDLYQSYERWVVNNFGTVMRRTASNIQENAVTTAGTGTHVVFNPNTSQYHFIDPQNRDSGTRQAVGEVNQAIRGLSSFLTAQGKNDDEVRSEVSEYIRALPLNVNTAPARTFWNRIRDAVHNFDVSMTPGADYAGPLSREPQYSDGSRTRVTNPEIYSQNARDYAPLLNLLGRGESDSIGGYTAVYGRQADPGLTDMTLTQVMAVQEDMRRQGSDSTAIGRYQFLQSTLRTAVNNLGLDPNTTRFTPEVQNQLATRLLSERGIERYLTNPTPEAENRLIDSLASEWAAVQMSSGRGRYDGDGLNRATIKPDEIRKILKELAKQYGRSAQ